MFSTILSVLFLALPGADDPAMNDVKTLLATIESLQLPLEDFRCEFEGTMYFKGKSAENEKKRIGEDGLYETFSGVFIWKKGGDTHNDSLVRRAVDNQIVRESLVVRMQQKQAEWYHRDNDAALGVSVIKSLKEVNSWRPECPAWIFLIDKIKRDVADEYLVPSVSDDQIDGRPLKVLSIMLKDVPDSLTCRYWIDLGRNGHVVRVETYFRGKVLGSRLEIKLAPFKIGDAEMWMPVSGDTVGYGSVVDKKPVVMKEPTVLQRIDIVGSTVEFNRKPGLDAFTIKYKLGTPISDNLRKLNTEFGQQKIGIRPTKVNAEKMLNQQIAKAEEQKSELVVASTSEGFDWWPWTVGGLGAVVLVSSTALWIQKSGR